MAADKEGIVKFLITTSKGLGLLDGDKLRMISETDDKRVFGITWNDRQVFVSRNTPTHSVIDVYGRDLRKTGEIKNTAHMQDVHQIYWTNGNLYCCNTKHNQICWWDGKRWDWFSWRPDRDGKHHFNSIWADGDGNLYFIEHNRHKVPTRRSRIYMFDRHHQRKDSWQVGRGSHNVYREGATFWVNSSCDFTFVRYNTKSKEIIHEVDMPDQHIYSYDFWHTRGLCFDGDRFYIGLSEWLPRDRQRFAMKAAIAVVSADKKRGQMKYERYIEVPGVGQIYDIRLIDKPDLAHNGIPF